MSAQSISERGWFWQYPKPQGNDLNDVFLFNSDRAVAVGNIGTVIQTADGGMHWQVQHHAGGSSCDLYGVHFTDSLNGWAAGGIRFQNKNVVLHTTDGGATWATVLSDTTLCYLAVYFVDQDTGFVAGEDGILLRTSDGGTTWDIRKMDDYIGLGWLDIFELLRITFTDKNNGWIVGAGYYGNQIYTTSDCGRTWQWNELVILPKIYSGFNDICFVEKKYGFIVGEAGIFLRSTDGGVSWIVRNLSEQYHKEAYQYFHSVAFTDSLTGWIVGPGYILQTTDGGENWTELGVGIALNKVWLAQSEAPASARVGWTVGGRGMLYRTTDTGAHWEAQTQRSYELRSTAFIDQDHGYAVGGGGIILHTSDGGSQWLVQNQADSVLLLSVFAHHNPAAFAVGTVIDGTSGQAKKAVLFRTSDSGLTWTEQIDDRSILYNSIAFSTPSVGWISAAYGEFFKSTDSGLSWSKVSLDSGVSAATGRIQFVDSLTGWIGGSLKTTDGGLHWRNQPMPVLSFPSTYFVNSLDGWCVGDATGDTNIFKTTDGGDSWLPLRQTYPGNRFTVVFVNQTTGWIAGQNYSMQESIIKTTDGGKTWNAQSIPSKMLLDMTFANETTGWVVGDGIFKTTDGGGLVSVSEGRRPLGAGPAQAQLLQNYPNPFNPATIISYQLSQAGFVTLRVYDLLGQLVTTLVDRWQPSGQYQVRWEASDLATGVYFYTLRSGATYDTKKMILTK